MASLGKLSIELGGDTAGLDAAHASSSQVLKAMAANVKAATGLASAAFTALSVDTVTQMRIATLAIRVMSATSVVALKALTFAVNNARALIIGGLVFTGAVLAINALRNAVTSTIDTFEEASQAADRFGISVEAFSRLGFAARVAGVDAKTLEAAIGSLVKATENADDPVAASTRALAALGVKIGDIAKDPAAAERALLQLANRFQGMENGVNKTALAVALFGEHHKVMLPFLDRGAAGIAELTGQADRFGATISGRASAASIEYNNNMRKLGELMSLVGKNVGETLIPVFNRASGALLGFAERINLATHAGQLMRGVVATLHTAGQAMLAPFRAFAAILEGLVGASLEAVAGNFAGAKDRLAKIGADIATVFADFGQTAVNNIAYANPAFAGLAEAADRVRGKLDWSATITRNKAPLMETAEQARERLAAAAEQARMLFDALMRDPVMPAADKIAALNKMLEDGGIKARQHANALMQVEQETQRLNAAFNQMQARDLVDNKELPMTEKVRQLNEMVQSGAIGWRDYLGSMKEVQGQGERAMDDLLSASSNALTQIFGENKTAAIAAALINTYQAVSKAFAQYGPTPQGFAMAGIAAAVGMAQVAKIRSTSKSGSGGGGAGVSGGSSSGAAAAAAPAQQPGSNSTLFVRGIDPKQMFSGDVMRALASQLIQHQKDGGRIILEAA